MVRGFIAAVFIAGERCYGEVLSDSALLGQYSGKFASR